MTIRFVSQDTAATNTVIDRTSLDIISLMDKVIPSGSGEFETAHGMKSIDKFKVASFSCFGIEVIDFEVYSFDFITQKVFYEFHGILGADFLLNHKICIDYPNKKITMQ